jgi:hypothetical protein
MLIRFISLFILSVLLNVSAGKDLPLRQKIALQGDWQFDIDSLRKGIDGKWFQKTLKDNIILPGTMDENHKGIPNKNKTETMRLSREMTYEGWAWYRKEINIPDHWNGLNIKLFMERTKPSRVWIDSIAAGSSVDILTPQEYDLSELLKPGSHTITILIDNGRGAVPRGITGSHAWTEHTQTNWNGITGEFCLEAVNPDHIEFVKVYPEIESKSVHVKTRIFIDGMKKKKAELTMKAEAWNTSEKHDVPALKIPVSLNPGNNDLEFEYPLGEKTIQWSEFNPALYKLTLSLSERKETDRTTVDFGMRKFSTRGTQFTINDKVTFLRGKHDACVFPLTGHPPMDVESWRRVFRIAKSYNINFYRFHSWAPPEAAFIAADIEGMYLQPELPFWGSFQSNNKELNDFLLNTGDAILDKYANHASFVMFALGNELSGDQQVMKDFLKHFRVTDNRPLMSFGSNNYLGYKGHADGEDYYAGCRIGPDADNSYRSHIRASFSFADAADGGYINGCYPSTSANYSNAISKCNVPAISTEVGQYQIYPDYNEIQKYTGVLKPWNFLVFRKRLQEAGMDDQAFDFFRASGALSLICYRADIEMALRTPGMGGFHLLDLQDFPGQGTALVGILDAFMDSKGLITPQEFSNFCNPVVPLFITQKFCWKNDEILKGKIQVANYSDKAINSSVSWTLKNSDEEIIARGKSEAEAGQGKVSDIIDLDINLSGIVKAEKTILTIKIDNTGYGNTYPIWIYPADVDISTPTDVIVTTKLDDSVLSKLGKGAKVLLFPDFEDVKDNTVGGLFTTDYWNFRMFKGISESAKKPVSPGTMGLLMIPEHTLFSEFPTEFHSNWQWWTIVRNSHPFILDRAPKGYKPVIQVIDNVERNHKLGLVFEFRTGKGKLLVCMSDLPAIADKPEARQLYHSILKYMASDKFNPEQAISADELKDLFSAVADTKVITGVKNISYSKD